MGGREGGGGTGAGWGTPSVMTQSVAVPLQSLIQCTSSTAVRNWQSHKDDVREPSSTSLLCSESFSSAGLSWGSGSTTSSPCELVPAKTVL